MLMKLIAGEELNAELKVMVTPIGPTDGVCMDVTLDNIFLVENKRSGRDRLENINPEAVGSTYPHMTALERGNFILKPGAFILAQTKEVFNIPLDVIAELSLRSRMARSGLDQMTSLTMKPGFHGHLVLELKNCLRNHAIELTAGMAIGQVSFFRLDRFIHGSKQSSFNKQSLKTILTK